MISINILKLAKLFDNKILREWLSKNASSELKSINEVKRSKINKVILQTHIIKTFNEIYKSNKGEEFSKFIESKFPEVIISDEDIPLYAKLMVKEITDYKIFSAYHPNLLRLPMQMVLQSTDKTQLIEATKLFISQYKIF